MKGAISLFVAVFFLLLSVIAFVAIQLAKGTGTIYIRADGSIDPPTAPISTTDNITYTFTGDINDSVVIERDNIIVDGMDHTIQGKGSGTGVYLSERNNVTVRNAEIRAFDTGISLSLSFGNVISGNTITSNNKWEGVSFLNSHNNAISGNNITSNNRGIRFQDSSNNIIYGNRIENNIYQGFYDSGSSNNNTVSRNIIKNNNHDGVYFTTSSDNTVSENSIESNANGGVYLTYSTSNNIVYGNNITSNKYGVGLGGSLNRVFGNNMTNNTRGINISWSSNNTVTGNNIKDSTHYGIYAYGTTSFNIFSENRIENSGYRGIELSNSTNNSFHGNTITNNENFGIYLLGSSSNTFSENNITRNYDGLYLNGNLNALTANAITTNNGWGINLYACSGTSILGNNITDNEWGIEINQCSYSQLRNNSIAGNKYNFDLSGGSALSHFVHDIDTSNTLDGKPICYWINHQSEEVPSDAGYVALVNSVNITVDGMTLKNNGQGICLANTTDSQITNNKITDNRFGIKTFVSSNNNAFCGNTIANNTFYGVYLSYSFNNTICENSITNSWYGVSLTGSSYNSVHGNRITSNAVCGISLRTAYNNAITGNNITNNRDYGISLYSSSSNTFFHNNLVNNTEHVRLETFGYANAWDNGYPSGGNFWSNITGVDLLGGLYQNETGSDGIGDAAHRIDASNTDNYPLMQPYQGPVRNMDTGRSYPTIQKAINNASQGDAILVLPGTYYENVVVNKTVSLIGESKSNTIVDGNKTGNVITITASNVNLASFTVKNSGAFANAGIRIDHSSGNNISENDLTNNYHGILLYSSCNNNAFYGNNIANNIYGIYHSSSFNNNIFGNTITGNQYGIAIIQSSYNSVSGNNMTNNTNLGIYLSTSSCNSVSGNNITNNGRSISLTQSSCNNSIFGNNIVHNDKGFVLLDHSDHNSIYENAILANDDNGIRIDGGSGNTVTANTVTANNGSGIAGSSSNSIISGNNITDNNGAGIALQGSETTISGNNIANNDDDGISLWVSSETSISGNNITANNGNGIFLSEDSNSTITGNSITENIGGIGVANGSNNCTISGNNIKESNDNDTYYSGYGILFTSSPNNTVFGNDIANNYKGILIEYCSGNSFSANNLTNNAYGIYFMWCSNNTFHHNNIMNNTQQAYDYPWYPSINIWHDGYPSGGNYWSDYIGVDLLSGLYQNETGGDGMGDTPYVVDVNNKDHYPLMNPWPDTTAPTMSVLSPQNITYTTSSIPLSFTASEATSWIGYSLDNQANVTIAGNTTLTDLSLGPHNLIVYANDSYGNMGSSDKVYFTIVVRDVAVLNVTASPIETYVNQIVGINVTVKNKGTVPETFNVTAYCDSNPINTETIVNLAPDSNTTITFSWNTTGIQKGTYTISAEAQIVPGETYTTDNTYIDNTVTILDRPPTIDSFTPTDTTPEINESESLEFTQTSSDPDNDTLTCSWLLDSVQQTTNQNWTYSTDYDDAGVHNVTLVVSDGVLLDSQEWSVTVADVNRYPTIDTFTPTEPEPEVNEAESLEFTHTSSDPDGDPLTYSWLLDSTEQSTAQNWTYSPNYDDAGTRNITLIVSDGELTDSQQWTVTVININRPPTAPVTDVTPDTPATDDDLTCTVTTPSSDPDEDPITYTYEWYRDQGAGFVLQPDLTTTTSELSSTIGSSNTTKGDIWRCVVTPNDGLVNGTSDYDQVSIGNTPPTTPTIDLTPNTPTTTDNLVCTITTSSNDPDEDTITYFYEWHKNEILQPSLTTNTVPSSETAKGEIWKCIVTPFDGTENGTSSEDQVTIQNSAPSIVSVEITPDPAYTNTDLTATPSGWSDPDGDSAAYIYQWQEWVSGNWQNISGATSQTLSSSNFARNHQIKVICTPFDGISYGTAEEDAITILDSPPTIDSFTPIDVEPDVNEGGSLEFTHTSSDFDDDSLAYSWLLDSIEQSTGQNWTYSPDYDDAGPHNLTLVVSDGELADSQQWSVTVVNVNRPAVIDTSYPLTDPTINEGESQEFNITKLDLDGDPLTVTWWLNQSNTGETSDSYAYTADYGSAGKYNITVIVSDGLLQTSRQWILTVTNVERDVAIINLIPSKNIVGQGYIMNITVTVENRGDLTETFSVKAYANTTIIQTGETTLASGNSITVTFTWNTTGFAKGNYTISAVADIVPGEISTSDNILVDGWVFVSIPGDVNADRKVDLKDVFAVGKAFGTTRLGPNPPGRVYVPNCDINDDDKIDLKDYFTTCKNYGKSW